MKNILKTYFKNIDNIFIDVKSINEGDIIIKLLKESNIEWGGMLSEAAYDCIGSNIDLCYINIDLNNIITSPECLYFVSKSIINEIKNNYIILKFNDCLDILTKIKSNMWGIKNEK